MSLSSTRATDSVVICALEASFMSVRSLISVFEQVRPIAAPTFQQHTEQKHAQQQQRLAAEQSWETTGTIKKRTNKQNYQATHFPFHRCCFSVSAGY